LADEDVQELIRWIAVLIKEAGGEIYIPRRFIEELDYTDIIHYDKDIEGNITLKLKRNLVLDVSGYSDDIAQYDSAT